ncbi:claudin-7 [Paramormyrops kingsleyae]|uniref:Claudin n=1 Tax=Paramormyrops kingsleyae TaxID=1676925 RepID=A0A3B3RYW3_9TELE|nr:claudin-7-like [Paramormyrops kingsleyae]
MANLGVQLLGFSMAVIGLIGLIASTAMVEWKASSYAGQNIVTAQAMYEGLWKTCVSQSTGQIQCKVYDSLLQMPAEIQATRALMIASILLSGLGLLVAMVGMKCTTCMADAPEQKDKVAIAGGVFFIVAGFCALVGTSWYGNKIATDFYNPFTPTNARYEFGSALFVGWGAAALSMLGGGFLCCHCHGAASKSSARYPKSSQPAASGYV